MTSAALEGPDDQDNSALSLSSPCSSSFSHSSWSSSSLSSSSSSSSSPSTSSTSLSLYSTPLSSSQTASDDQENSELVWAFEKIKDLDKDDVNLYLRFASTACVPGGGCDIEQALDVLYKCKGDIMQATSCLLSRDTDGHTVWTINEKQSFEQAFSKYPKDFCNISRELKTKTVRECVRYYYLWKRSLSRKQQTTPKLTIQLSNGNLGTNTAHQQLNHHHSQQRPRTPQQQTQQYQQIVETLTPTNQTTTLQLLSAIPTATLTPSSALDSVPTPSSSASEESRDSGRGDSSLFDPCNQQVLVHHQEQQQILDPQAEVFPCKVCGREFPKIKSRSAHMKKHKNERLYG